MCTCSRQHAHVTCVGVGEFFKLTCAGKTWQRTGRAIGAFVGLHGQIRIYENASARGIGLERLTRELDRGAEAVAPDAVAGGEGEREGGREGESEIGRERGREGQQRRRRSAVRRYRIREEHSAGVQGLGVASGSPRRLR